MDVSNLTLWKLEIFCRVLEEKSFSRAARALSVSQPTVSGHVADLERLFGTRLFDRTGGEIVPTAAGLCLSEQGRQLNLLRDETIRVMMNLIGVIEGELVIGASTIPGTYLLPEVLTRFKQAFPDIQTRLKVGDSAAVSAWVEEGALELGVVGSPPRSKVLRATPLTEDQLVLITAPDHPLAAQPSAPASALVGQPLLMRESGSGTRQLIESALADAEMKLEELQVVCELGSSAAIKEAVMSGLGIALTSRLAVSREQAAGQLAVIELSDLALQRQLLVIQHQKRTLSPGARQLLALMERSPSR